MRIEDGVTYPDPNSGQRRTLTQSEAVSVFSALTKLGLNCVLEHSGGEFVVKASVNGLSADELVKANAAIKSVLFDDETKIYFVGEHLTVE